jgi:hypothetical protein
MPISDDEEKEGKKITPKIDMARTLIKPCRTLDPIAFCSSYNMPITPKDDVKISFSIDRDNLKEQRRISSVAMFRDL